MTENEQFNHKQEKQEETARDIKNEELMHCDFDYALESTGVLDFIAKIHNELDSYGWKLTRDELIDRIKGL